MKYFDGLSGIGGFAQGITKSYDNRRNIRNRASDIQKNMPNVEEREIGTTCVGFS